VHGEESTRLGISVTLFRNTKSKGAGWQKGPSKLSLTLKRRKSVRGEETEKTMYTQSVRFLAVGSEGLTQVWKDKGFSKKEGLSQRDYIPPS